MRILLTGGGGFLGARLARELLKAGRIDGRPLTELAIADLAPPPADIAADPRVKAYTGPMLSQTALFASGFDGVFHLASAVSGECELDFELGLRSNLDSTRALLEGLRQAGNVPRLVFASSVAVFGPDASNPLPDLVTDSTLPSPQTSYGTHKLMCEFLVADYTRKGYIDGRSARLMTVFEASRDAMGGRLALNLPGLNVRVGDMLDALEAVAGAKVRARVRFERDERIAGIVANWSRGSTADRAKALGLLPETSFRGIIEQYIADCRERPGYPADALRGLD